jgi:hypothetical protein
LSAAAADMLPQVNSRCFWEIELNELAAMERVFFLTILANQFKRALIHIPLIATAIVFIWCNKFELKLISPKFNR